jgi:hypothetical protein
MASCVVARGHTRMPQGRERHGLRRATVGLGLSLLSAFTAVFTRPGWGRVVQWVTGMVLCWGEHGPTPILTALGLESRWRALEPFAADGTWDREAADDTTRHRTSTQVWGTCTCHEASARSPNRAETARAHHWVVMGPLHVS